MGDEGVNPPDIADGAQFGRSKAKTVGYLIVAILWFLFGCLLLCIWIAPRTNQLTWWGYILCIGSLLGGPIFGAYVIWLLIVRRRIVAGVDCVQMVQVVKGEDEVIVHIPFANIEEIKYEATSDERRIGIDLIDLDDPDTYAPGENFQFNMTQHGRHFRILGGYQANLKLICESLKRSMKKWSRREEEE